MRQEGNRSKDCHTEKSIFKLCLRDKIWKYRGEGNANLVIALPKERLILRFHKWERGKEVTAQVEVEEDKRVWREVLFCRSVMVPLLGSAYIQPPKLAYLDSDEITKLDAGLRALRPVYRMHKGVKFGYVTIYPDYALLPSNLKIGNISSGCSTYCKMLLPLKSIENQNYHVDDVCASVMNVKRLNHFKNRCASLCYLSNQECDEDDENGNSDSFDDTDFDNDTDDDIFIENYKNINKSIDIPSIYNRSENYVDLINYCQLPPSRNCYQIRGKRRFSTGSDSKIVPNNYSFSNLSFNSTNPHMVSSSAPVYSQLILDMNNRNIPVFCVEIKPKQGWIPLMDRFNPKCTFCLNQYLKLSKGSVESISQYCPLDLFSGNELRMRNALRNLLFTPQNNLKLFHDGVMIYSGDMKTNLYSILNEWFKSSSNYSTKEDNLNKLIDKFCDLVINALTTDLTDGEKFPLIENVSMPESSAQEKNICDLVQSSPVISSSNHILNSSQSCNWSSQPLPHNCILDRILKIQQLEQSGADTIYRLSKNVCPKESDYEYVTKLCDHPDGVFKLDPIQCYLLATTAKDCSILIAFQRINNDHCSNLRTMHVMKDTHRVSYAWNIGISDLDPKPLSCIEKHRKRDADVISAFLEYFKNT